MAYTPEFENYWAGITPTFDKSEANKALQFEQFQTMGAPTTTKSVDKPENQFLPTGQQKTEASGFSGGEGEKIINEDKSYLDQTAPLTYEQKKQKAYETGRPFTESNGEIKFADTGETFNPEQPKTESTGKAYYTNELGQEFEYTNDQLKSAQTQQEIRDKGLILTKQDAGVNVNYDPIAQEAKKKAQDATMAVEKLTQDWLSYNVDQDPAFKRQAENITSEFDKLRREMAQTNYQRQRAYETLGYRTGTEQYAGGISGGIVGEEINQGSQRIAEINRQEAQAISSARLAFETGKYTKFSQQVDALKDIREQKQKELENFNKVLADQTKNLQEKNKLDFEIYKFQKEQKAKGVEKPFAVAPGSSVYDPTTGKFIGTAPKPADIKAPEIQKWGGQVHQWNPTTSRWDTLGSENDLVSASSDNISAANLIASGKAKLTDYAQENRGAISSLLEKMPPKQEDVTKIQTKISELNDLLNSKGKDRAVGAYTLSRWTPIKIDKGEYLNFIGQVEKLLSDKTLKTLVDAKAQGATFGALSEGELNILTRASSAIGTWARDPNKDGVPDYYEIDENSFDNEIKRIKKEYEDLIKTNAPNAPTNSIVQKIDDYYVKNPSKREFIDKLESDNNPKTQKPYTDEEKAQILGISFNEVAGDTNIAKISSAIGQFESGGNYKAIGPDTGNGNKAYGKYQIMASNVPGWTKEALGYSMTPKDFLNNPDAQDKVAQYKMNQYYQKYGTVEDVASAWFSGRPLAKAGNAKDVIGTSVPKYVKNVISIYNKV